MPALGQDGRSVPVLFYVDIGWTQRFHGRRRSYVAGRTLPCCPWLAVRTDGGMRVFVALVGIVLAGCAFFSDAQSCARDGLAADVEGDGLDDSVGVGDEQQEYVAGFSPTCANSPGNRL